VKLSNRFLHNWPYEVAGKPDKPVIVLLHGFLGSSRDWRQISELFLAQDFFCVMPSLPGHAEHPPSAPLNFDTVADGLYTFLRKLGFERVNLVGYSMGGRLALYFALKYQSFVSRLVLEGASPGIADQQARLARAVQDDERAVQLVQGGVEAFVDDWYRMELFASLKQHPELLAKVIRQRKQNNACWASIVIRELSPGRQPSLWSRLGELTIRVLLIAGALDRKYVMISHEMEKYIPCARTEVIAATGHNVHLEQPGVFTQHLKKFFCASDYKEEPGGTGVR
jgi:2-succinyl-6-hydroxy-2,4-cyclohexadiene-1-carboxylate synthase